MTNSTIVKTKLCNPQTSRSYTQFKFFPNVTIRYCIPTCTNRVYSKHYLKKIIKGIVV